MSSIKIAKRISSTLKYALIAFYYLFLPFNFVGRVLFTFYYSLDYHSQYGHSIKKKLVLPFFLIVTSSLSLLGAALSFSFFILSTILNLSSYLIQIPFNFYDVETLTTSFLTKQSQLLKNFKKNLSPIKKYFKNPRIFSFDEARFSHVSIWNFTKIPQLLLKSLISILALDHSINNENQSSIFDLLARSNLGLSLIETINSIDKYLKSIFTNEPTIDTDHQEEDDELNEHLSLDQLRIYFNEAEMAEIEIIFSNPPSHPTPNQSSLIERITRLNRLKKLDLPQDAPFNISSKLKLAFLENPLASIGLKYDEIDVLFLSFASFVDQFKKIEIIKISFENLISSFFQVHFTLLTNLSPNRNIKSVQDLCKYHSDILINTIFNQNLLKEAVKNIQGLSGFLYYFSKVPKNEISIQATTIAQEILLKNLKEGEAVDPDQIKILATIYLKATSPLTLKNRLFYQFVADYFNNYLKEILIALNDYSASLLYIHRYPPVIGTAIDYTEPENRIYLYERDTLSDLSIDHNFIYGLMKYLSKNQSKSLSVIQNYLNTDSLLKKVNMLLPSIFLIGSYTLIRLKDSSRNLRVSKNLKKLFCRHYLSISQENSNWPALFNPERSFLDFLKEIPLNILSRFQSLDRNIFEPQIMNTYTRNLISFTDTYYDLQLTADQKHSIKNAFLSFLIGLEFNNANQRIRPLYSESGQYLVSILDLLNPELEMTTSEFLANSLLILMHNIKESGLFNDIQIQDEASQEITRICKKIKIIPFDHIEPISLINNIISLFINGLIHEHRFKRELPGYADKFDRIKKHLISIRTSNNDIFKLLRKDRTITLIEDSIYHQFSCAPEHHQDSVINDLRIFISRNNIPRDILNTHNAKIIFSTIPSIIGSLLENSNDFEKLISFATNKKSLKFIYELPTLIIPARNVMQTMTMISSNNNKKSSIIAGFQPDNLERSLKFSKAAIRVVFPVLLFFYFQPFLKLFTLYGLTSITATALSNKTLARKLKISEETSSKTIKFLNNINIWYLFAPIFLLSLLASRSLNLLNPLSTIFFSSSTLILSIYFFNNMIQVKGQSNDLIAETSGDLISLLLSNIFSKIYKDTSLSSLLKNSYKLIGSSQSISLEPNQLSLAILNTYNASADQKQYLTQLLNTCLSLFKSTQSNKYKLISSLYQTTLDNFKRRMTSSILTDLIQNPENGIFVLNSINDELYTCITQLQQRQEWPTRPDLFTDHRFKLPVIDNLLTEIYTLEKTAIQQRTDCINQVGIPPLYQQLFWSGLSSIQKSLSFEPSSRF